MTSTLTSRPHHWVKLDGEDGKFIHVEHEMLVVRLCGDFRGLQCRSLDDLITKIFDCEDHAAGTDLFVQFTDAVLRAEEEWIQTLQRGGSTALQRSRLGAANSQTFAELRTWIRISALHDVWQSLAPHKRRTFLRSGGRIIDDSAWSRFLYGLPDGDMEAWSATVSGPEDFDDSDYGTRKSPTLKTGRTIMERVTADTVLQHEKLFRICHNEGRGSDAPPDLLEQAQKIWSEEELLTHYKSWEQFLSEEEKKCLELGHETYWDPHWRVNPKDPSCTLPYSGPGGVWEDTTVKAASTISPAVAVREEKDVSEGGMSSAPSETVEVPSRDRSPIPTGTRTGYSWLLTLLGLN